MVDVVTNGSVLSWAREQAMLSLDDAAVVLQVPRETVTAWESGSTQPSWTVIQRMSDRYDIPVAMLLLQKPPPAAPVPGPIDFRGRGADASLGSRRALRRAVSQVRSWKATLQRLGVVFEVTVPEADQRSSPERVARTVRETLGVTNDEQVSWASTEHALFRWRDAVESTGPLVFALTHLDRDVCRGFSLWDDGAPPLIALASEADQAKIFTLLHEYAHLMLRSSAVCDQVNSATRRGATEAFCNAVAAYVLMPEDLIETTWARFDVAASPEVDRQALRPYAQHLHVSVPALALRLEQLGRIPSGTFQRLNDESWDYPPDRWRRPGGGGSNTHPSPTIAERGITFSNAVYSAWRSGTIGLGDAARAMGIRPQYVELIGSKLDARQSRLGRRGGAARSSAESREQRA